MAIETLTDILVANRDADRAMHYLEGEQDHRTVPFGALHDHALGILGHLQAAGAQAGDKLILFLNQNQQFIEGFWGALAGGIVPVPLAVGISDEHRHKLLRIARKLGDPFIYTDRKTLERIGAFAAGVGEAETFARLERRAILIEHLGDLSHPGTPVPRRAEDLAFIQFSSGSTSQPKGIVLTHANVMANLAGATAAARFCADDVAVSWMPLTHDMGLIGKHIFMFANRIQNHLMPTELFIRRPLLWPQFASQLGATILSSPNFGYRHFLKVLDDRELPGIDLSAVRLIFNGAEPISVALCDEFMGRMARYGLRRHSMFPVYGLAEATLAVTFPDPQSDYSHRTFDRHHLNPGDAVVETSATGLDALPLMNVGRPIPGTDLRIADATGAALPAGRVGRILIRGGNVTHGYFEDAEASARAIDAAGWLDTGDLGVVVADDLYVTGRAKEIIFVNGQNYFPHDLESIAQQASGLELGKVVAAGCRPAGAEGDELTFFVLHRGALDEFLGTAQEITRLVNEHAGLEVRHVVPVKRIPKTTSGKIQRVVLEEAFVGGEFAADMAQLDALRQAAHGHGHRDAGTSLEQRLLAICVDALAGKAVEPDDNLFEIGASSLTLIQIHEEIDRQFPNAIDLTELFDFPTVAQLAAHLGTKIGQD